LNCKVEILISRGGDFVCACFFFGFGRHIEIPLTTSLASLRQGKSKRGHFSTGMLCGGESCQEKEKAAGHSDLRPLVPSRFRFRKRRSYAV
jgi:hypothetical protein